MNVAFRSFILSWSQTANKRIELHIVNFFVILNMFEEEKADDTVKGTIYIVDILILGIYSGKEIV